MEEKRSSNWAIAATCSGLLLLVIAGGFFAMRDQLLTQSRADAKEHEEARNKLATRISALQSTVDSMGTQTGTDTTALETINTTLTETNNKLTALSKRIDALEKKAEEKKPEPVAAAPAAPAPAPVAATPAPEAPTQFTTLKLAVMSGKPFAIELTQWLKLHPESEKDTAALSDIAITGLISEAELTRQLLNALDIKPAAVKVDDTSLSGKINTHLKGLVSIKKTTTDPYAQLRKDALREDISTLISAIEGLNDTDRAPLEGWLKSAKARSAAIESLNKLAPVGN